MPDSYALLSAQSGLRAAGIDVSDVSDNVSVESIYLSDNGIAIEIARWKVDPTGKAAQYDNPVFFADSEAAGTDPRLSRPTLYLA